MFKRHAYSILLKRLKEKRRFIQVVGGPRQVGKTTLVDQVIEALNVPTIYASADEPTLQNHAWIKQQWDLGRIQANEKKAAILFLDEIQKVPEWSSIIKLLWDEDTRSGIPLKVVLLGSAPLLIQKGLSESLAGRFELIPVTHWSFAEMHEAFGWSLDQYIYFGGYPGAAELIQDEDRWRRYINDSLIETTLSRDILLLNPIHKPALLRQLLKLSCDYSGQILSFNKMLGQLHDAGNTTTLSHYLELLKGVGMVAGIEKFSGNKLIRQRGSSPKLQVFNTALISACANSSFEEAKKNKEYWGRLVESTIGAHLLNNTLTNQIDLYYWREGNNEVDFILQVNKKIIAIEVKSAHRSNVHLGLQNFSNKFNVNRNLLIGTNALPLEVFLKEPIHKWLE